MSAAEPDPDEIEVPTGPFVWWGRQVARVLAPSAGLGAVDVIGVSIMGGHIFAGSVLAMVSVWWAIIPTFLLGAVAAARYAANCRARRAMLIAGLREENPDMEVVEV